MQEDGTSGAASLPEPDLLRTRGGIRAVRSLRQSSSWRFGEHVKLKKTTKKNATKQETTIASAGGTSGKVQGSDGGSLRGTSSRLLSFM